MSESQQRGKSEAPLAAEGSAPESSPPSWFKRAAAMLGMIPPITEDNTVYGPRLVKYPSSADASNARQYEQAYGTGNEAFVGGQRVNMWSLPGPEPKPARVEDFGNPTKAATDPRAANMLPGTPETGDVYGAAQLAILRSPISAIGYDPGKFALDTKTGRDVTLAGMYSPKDDRGYSNTSYPGNLVHESTHRGLEKLRQAGVVPEAIWKRLPDEESVVRYIMALHMGDPEKGRGDESDRQRYSGLTAFGHDPQDPQKYYKGLSPSTALDRRKALNELNDIAAKYFASQQPGGGVLPGGPH